MVKVNFQNNPWTKINSLHSKSMQGVALGCEVGNWRARPSRMVNGTANVFIFFSAFVMEYH